jgi:nucleotide-binding universal stress UspA family protein
MIRSMLIPIDGSRFTETAVELAIRWARRTGGVLVGLGIIDEPTIRQLEGTGIAGSYYGLRRDEQWPQDARPRIAILLERFARRCARAEVPCRVLDRTGLPWEQIVREAEEYDLTLLGQRTYFHFETQTDPDETLEIVLQKSRRPVVAVGHKIPASRSVVVAYDGSPAAVRALEAFQKAGLDQWQDVRVVSVAPNPADAARRAKDAVRSLRSCNVPAEGRSLPLARTTGELLLEQVQGMGAGMLVMGAFGTSELASSCFSSTTLTILEEERDFLLFLHH